MSHYERLAGDAPAIPTLEQIRTGEAAPTSVVATLPEQTPAQSEKQQPVVVESYEVAASNVVPAEAPPSACLVTRCCCFSLSTGVYLIAMFEAVNWVFALIGAGVAIFIKTQEKKIDHAIEKEYAAEEATQEEDYAAEQGEAKDGADPSASEEDNMSAEQMVRSFNRMADLAFYSAPFVILCALIGLYFVNKGFRAAKGDAVAAQVYYRWTRFQAAWRFVLLLFDGGSGLFSFLLAVYYVMVTRSHALKLEEEAAERPRVLPADSVTVVTRRVDVPDGAQV